MILWREKAILMLIRVESDTLGQLRAKSKSAEWGYIMVEPVVSVQKMIKFQVQQLQVQG